MNNENIDPYEYQYDQQEFLADNHSRSEDSAFKKEQSEEMYYRSLKEELPELKPIQDSKNRQWKRGKNDSDTKLGGTLKRHRS